MSRFTRFAFKFLDLLVIFMMTFGSAMPVLADASPTGATVTTQLPDYPPGATVLMTGAGWAAQEAVHIVVNDQVGNTWMLESNPDPVADELGGFTYQFQLPDWFVATYLVTATGYASGTATLTFTDLSIGTYDQCSNDTGTGYTSGDTGCRWINGNLQGNNSYYAEGDATVQRLWLTDLVPGSTHTMVFDYGTTKGGKHAYDFLTTWNWSENWITVDDRCQGITGCTTAGETAFNIPNDPNVPDTFEPNTPGARQFTMRGGTLTGASFATPIPFTGSYSGDSDTRIAVTFTTAVAGDMCSTKSGVTTCGVALWFGAHVAAQANWGLGLGAASISGSPYHVSLAELDGASIGSRDNQMQASAVTVIPNGTIVIVKDAVPNDAQDFGFNLQNNPLTISQNFSLDDDSDATLPNSQTFSVPPGTWTAQELNLPITGWDLTKLVCTVAGTNGSNTTVDLATAKATITLKSNDTVTCTYTNTKRGTIIVKKTTTGGDATFAYTTTGGDGFPADFNITTSSGSGSQTYTNIVPGTYSVAETPLTGWTLTGSSCDTGTPSSFTVPAGGTVTCTFTNTRTYNKDLTVSKTATASFGRTDKWLIDKSVDQTTINIAEGGKATFNYSVKVTPNGYDDSNWAVAGKITIANPNGFDVAGVNVTDAIDNGGTCTVTGGTNVTVPKNGNVALDYSCTYAAASSPAAGTNTATATWNQASYDTPSSSASGTAGIDFSTVTPTETNKIITVVDDKTDPANPITLGTWNWADGEHTFTYSLDKQGVGGTCTDYTNTAKISETGQSDSQKVTVCVGKNLAVSKTAAGSYNREYVWKISKDVDKTSANIAEGGSYTFHYTVVAEQTGVIDSGYTVSGKITITNPNDWEDITLTGLTDTANNGGTCTVDAGPYTVPAGKSLEVNYTCAYALAPTSYSGFNTATATWDAATYFTPGGYSSGAASFTLAQAGETNKTIHVTDTYGGNLGTVTATDGAPLAKGTFTYDRTESGVAGKCTTYDNTATITETDQTASKEVTLCVGKDLTVSKTAAGTFDRTYLWKISKDVDKTSVNIADGGAYTFHYTINVEQTGVSDAGWALSGKITLTNPNDWEDITLTSLTDAVDNGGTCTVDAGPYVVPKNGSLAVNYTCSYGSAPSSFSGTNTVTATWDNTAYFTPTGSATGSAAFTLSQSGTTNKIVHVTDSYKGDLGTVTATDSAPFAKGTFTYDRTESGVVGKCTTYDNTATITETEQTADKTVTLCVGADLTVTKTAAGTFDRAYLWQINKDVDKTSVNIAAGGSYTFHYTVEVAQTGVTDAGWTLSGKITITNPNDWEDVTLTSLSDAVDNGGTCTVDPGPYKVLAGKSLDVNYTCSYASAPTSYSGTNTVTVNWDKAAAFTPTGSASGSAPFTLSQLGATNQTVHVTDSYGGDLGTVTATDAIPFATATFTYDRTESGVGGTCTTYDNTATIKETSQTASQSVALCVAKDLTVSKTAAGTFNRTYLWSIDKNVDKTSVNIADGTSYTFHYTVDVAQTGTSDAGWTLSGKITITNPNDWEAIMLTGLTDVVDNGGICTVDPTLPLVPKGGSVDVNYSCSYASAPSSFSGTNTVTATWDKATAFTPTGSATGSAPFTLSQLGATNKTVHVTDSYGGDLGTVTATDSDPFAKATFAYDRTESGVGGKCTTYDNTATITETGATADKSVTLCVAKDLTVTKTAAGTFDRTYLWQINKAVDKTSVNIAEGNSYTFQYTVNVEQTGFTDSGWTLSGKITLSNPNDWEDIMLTGLTDVVDNGGTCTVDPTLPLVPKGGSVDVNYTCSYASAPSSYSGLNTAIVNWNKALAFTPNGSASGNAGFALTQLGSTNKTVHVTDSYSGDLGTVTATDAAPFATATFTYDRTESGVAGKCTSYDNTAKITETGQTVDKSVTLCVGADLTVNKTATGTFDRTYRWLIDKSVDHTGINIAQGGTATFNYTVKVAPDGYTDSGWTLSGKITITNPNDWEDITADVTDSFVGGGTCTVTNGIGVVIPAGQSVTLDYSCTFDVQPVYTGANTATATWGKAAASTPSGSASGTADATLTLKGETYRTITVVDDKTNPANPVPLGTSDFYAGPFEFKYALDKQGVPGICTNYTNTAKITETGQSDSQTVRVCVGVDVKISKTANATLDRTYRWLIDKTVDQTRINIADGGTATFNYSVLAKPNGYTDSNYILGGTITLVNPNQWEDIIVSVVDVLDQGGNCSIVEHSPYIVHNSGIPLVLHYTCTTDGTTTKNTATATWSALAFSTPSGTASADAPVSFDVAHETYKTITVVDDKTDPTNPVTLGTSDYYAGPYEFAYSLEKQGVAGTCTDYTNTAVIDETKQSDSQTVTVCVGKDLTVTKTATPTFTRTYKWGISKSVDQTQVNIADGGTATFTYTVAVTHDNGTDSAWKVTGKITISNPNDWEDIVANVTDTLDTRACTVTGGTNVTVPKSGSVTLDYTCDPASANATKNTATAAWDKATYFTPNGSASGSADVAFTTPTTIVDGSVTVSDTLGGNLGTVSYTDPTPKSFTYSYVFSGDTAGTCTNHNNTATFTTNTTVTTGSASQTVKVCVGKDLTVSKTATPTFTRTFLWSITKDVDKTYATAYSGTVTFNYTVVAAETGFTDSAWKVVGTITITNPNDWEAITTNVADAVDNGGNCKVYDGATEVTSITLAKSGSKSLTYTCAWASQPSGYSGMNTATATWNKDTYTTPTGLASGTAGFTFDDGTTGNPTNINKTITVTDTFQGTTQTLGTVTAVTTIPYTSKTFTYSYTVNAPSASVCQKYDNTAKIVETGQTASQTVQVCKPSLITDTQHCSLIDNQYKLIYTPDQSNGWKLNASTPGQYYFNFFFSGYNGGEITITLPYPWVTQGTMPIHAYSDVGVVTKSGGQVCLTPGTLLPNPPESHVTMNTYDPGFPPASYNFSKTTTVTIQVPPSPTGFVYLDIHLDYGLKGTTGYAKGGPSGNDAVKLGTSTVQIPDKQSYTFSDTFTKSYGGPDVVITSLNAFKKDPGIGGLVQFVNKDGDPVASLANVKVEIYLGTSTKPTATVYTDAEGWYMWQYKWTGKAATFVVKVTPPSPYKAPASQTVILKANGYLVVSFTVTQ